MNSTAEEDSSWTVVDKKRSPKKDVQPTVNKQKINIDTRKNPPPKKGAQPSATKETMIIEPDLMGFVAGRKGIHLKRLKEIYGVKIVLPPRGGSVITIEGPAEMVSAAKKDIKDNLSCETSFSIEEDPIILVMGPKGENIRALQDALNVRITINKGGEVVITGTRCEEAKNAIKENLSRITKFSIENDYRYLIIGPKGETRSALEKAHNVNIKVEKDGKVSIMGFEREKAKKAIEFIIERTKTANPFKEKISVSELTACLVCGKNGSNVERIESTYNVLVFITPAKDESQILVIGSVAENVFTAMKDILENLKELPSLDVDKSLVGKIIGIRGETIRRLEKEHDVVVHFEKVGKDEMATGKVYIVGEKSRAEAVKDAILSLISGEHNSQEIKTVGDAIALI